MEGLGVVGEGVPQRFQVETTVASKGVAGFVFMAFSVHEHQVSPTRRWNAPDLTSEHDLALTTRVLNEQPAPAIQFGDIARRCDERALPVGSRPCGTDRPEQVATRTASLATLLATARPEAPEAFALPVASVAAIRRLTLDMSGTQRRHPP